MRQHVIGCTLLGMLLATPTQAQETGIWSADVEYLVWWLRRGHLPAVVTTGPTASQGVLGQPGTEVVYGDQRLQTRHSDRFIGTRFSLEWLAPEREFGIEGRAFFLERDSTYFTLKHRETPLLALSFVDGVTGKETSEVIAGFSAARNATLSGGFVGYSSIELFGQEINGVVPLSEEPNLRVDLLAGGRFLQMRSRYHQTATSWVQPEHEVLTGIEDNYRIHNAFYGAQVGARGEWHGERMFAQVRGSIALGFDDQLVRTFGERLYQDPTQKIETKTGLFVQQSNTGRFSRINFDAVGELAANLGWQLTPHVRALLGYTLLVWADPLRATDQVDRVIDRTSRPRIPFQGDMFWAHGVNMGVEVTW